jgi:PAS domain S-box-containing protein
LTGALLADERTRRLAAVLDDSNDAVITHDFAGNMITWNRGAEKIYGYSEIEALQMKLDLLIPENSIAMSRSQWERIRQGERVDSWESQRRAKDGRILDVWVAATVLRDAAGRPIAVAKTERDITERKRLELEIVEIASLEQRRIGQDLHDSVGQELAALGIWSRDCNEAKRNFGVFCGACSRSRSIPRGSWPRYRTCQTELNRMARWSACLIAATRFRSRTTSPRRISISSPKKPSKTPSDMLNPSRSA